MRDLEKSLGGLKSRVDALLREADPAERRDVWEALPGRRAVNPLLSFLYHVDEVLKWRAVTAVGIVVARMAEESMESARVVMRRLIWSLNDESGGIGWGAPEAMAEIMACHEGLAEEYARILVSYIVEEGNLLENGPLERGVLWGIGRLAQVRPALVRHSVPHLLRYLRSEDAGQRGFALWALDRFPGDVPPGAVEPLLPDEAGVRIFADGKVREYAVGDLAKRFLSSRSGQAGGQYG